MPREAAKSNPMGTTGAAARDRASSGAATRARASREAALGYGATASREAALGYGATAIVALGSILALGWRGNALVWALPAAAVVGILGYRCYRSRRAEIETHHRLRTELSIYRVGEVMAQPGPELALVESALDAIAEGTGIPHWALYARPRPGSAQALIATRGLAEETRATLAADPKELETRPDVITVSLPDQGEEAGVLLCFLPPGTTVDSERLALLRWMAAQLSAGLRRLRLERRDHLLASFLMSTGEILLGLDLSGRITHANRAAEVALGAEPGGLVGIPVDDIAEPDALPHGTSLVALARSAGEYSGEVWFLHPGGSRFPAQIRVSHASDREGAPGSMVLVGHDDTERREHEREIEIRSRELAQVNERLHALNHGLEEAQRQQNDFLANTSHELRTPLNAVIGFATLLEQGAQGDEAEGRDFARSIRESSEHLLAVINDLLDLAKVEAGRFQLRLQPGDIRLAIQAAAEAVGPAAGRKGLRLQMDLPPDPLGAALDPGRMRQVMLNLLGNAVKFTDRGEVRVRAWRDPETEEARVVIEDSGIGIPRERQAVLFTKYGQADTSYHRRHTGAGLGLAISRALVRNMGGTIAIESEGLNRGTRVLLVFPPALGSLLAARES